MADLKKLEQLNLDQVIHKEFAGASFQEVEKEIRNTQSVLLTILRAPSPETPAKIRTQLDREADNFLNHCQQAISYNTNQSNYINVRSQLIEWFRGCWETVGQYRGHALALGTEDLHVFSKEAKAIVEEMTGLKIAVEAARDDALKAAIEAKRAAHLSAVANLSAAYLEEGKTMSNRARRWGALALGVSIGTAIILGFFVHESLNQTNFSISHALIRATVVAVLFGAFHLCLRTHQAYSHLEVVNRHRVNIARTFEAFMAAQPSKEARDILAAITAEHMLAFGRSGLLAKDLSVQSPMSAAAELVRSILPNKPISS